MGRLRYQEAELGYCQKAQQYIADVLDGTIPACKWVKLACQRQVEDLARDVDFPFVFDVERAERICRFIELLPHVEGPKAKRGEFIRLEPWQCFILTTIFGWVYEFDVYDEFNTLIGKAGTRRFRRVYIEVPRGNGKSTLSAGVLIYMTFMDDEMGAQSYAMATSVEQAQAVYRPARLMIEKLPSFQKKYGVKNVSFRTIQESTNSFMRALPFKPVGLDSLNVHLAVVDELHEHRIRQPYESMESGATKREQPLIWTITTAGFDQAGICYEKHTYVQHILEKKLEPKQDEAFFGIIYTLDDEDDWRERSSWRKANPNFGISLSPSDFETQTYQAMQTAAKQNEFLVKHLDLWQNADVAWMNMVQWRACADSSLKIEDFTEDEAILGLDLASRLDFLALGKLYRREVDETKKGDDGQEYTDPAYHYYFFLDCWLPENSIKDSDNSQFDGWARMDLLHTCPGVTNNYDLVEEHVNEFADTTGEVWIVQVFLIPLDHCLFRVRPGFPVV